MAKAKSDRAALSLSVWFISYYIVLGWWRWQPTTTHVLEGRGRLLGQMRGRLCNMFLRESFTFPHATWADYFSICVIWEHPGKPCSCVCSPQWYNTLAGDHKAAPTSVTGQKGLRNGKLPSPLPLTYLAPIIFPPGGRWLPLRPPFSPPLTPPSLSGAFLLQVSEMQTGGMSTAYWERKIRGWAVTSRDAHSVNHFKYMLVWPENKSSHTMQRRSTDSTCGSAELVSFNHNHGCICDAGRNAIGTNSIPVNLSTIVSKEFPCLLGWNNLLCENRRTHTHHVVMPASALCRVISVTKQLVKLCLLFH